MPDALSGPRRTLSFPVALLGAAATVALLDGLEAVIFFGLRGTPPMRIFQFVAGGLLGREALDGGVATFALGLLCHFTVALSIATVYFLASRRLPALRERPVLCGAAYGVVAFFVMHYVVVPLSAAPAGAGRSAWPILVNGVLGHIFLVGLPIALFAARVRPRPEAGVALPTQA